MEYEYSPVESLLSAPGDSYTSLFDVTPASPTMEALTPASTMDHGTPNRSSVAPEDGATPEPENGKKKSGQKKRKSWGQVLPEPKTNLPPRKRAKTEDEKEQRRVERVLRNRRAAQSSRERKRMESEALEHTNAALKEQLAASQAQISSLVEELRRYKSSSVHSSNGPSTSTLDETLSSQLFSYNESDATGPAAYTSTSALGLNERTRTVNPASLSPTPLDLDSEEADQPHTLESPLADSSDLTQYPAVSSVGASQPSADSGVDGLSRGAGIDLSSFNTSTPIDPHHFVRESGLFDSPEREHLVNNNGAGESADLPTVAIDFGDWLAEDPSHGSNNTFASDFFGLELPSIDTESQLPEDPFQQPETGASPVGCDAHGLAVGI